MKQLINGLLVLAFLAPVSALADTVRCESKGGLKECEMNTRGEVRMVRQLSRADCIEGRTWGVNRHSVWVKDGCRAEFESGGGGSSANVGRDWDRGCSDAKNGSYDRSGNASEAYESGWQACKRQGNSSGGQNSSDVSGAAKSACMAAVKRRYGGQARDVYVVSSEFSQANSTVVVNANGERWRCLVSNNGTRVEDLSLQKGHSSANVGRDWDRGCSDAKNGSYDRSGNASEAYESGWQSCKNQNRPSGNVGGDWDRGCSDAKNGSYDRSGNASEAYESGWQSCKNQHSSSGQQNKPAANNDKEWARGCEDAKNDYYQKSDKHGQAYDAGWQACKKK